MPADLNDYFNKKNGSGGGSNNRNSNSQPFNFKTPDLNFMKGFGKFMPLLYTLIIVIVVLVLAKPFAIVNEGEKGIKVTTGSYDPVPLNSGLHFFVPIFQKIIIVDTRQRQMTYTSPEGPANLQGSGIVDKSSISVLDSRGLNVLVNITVKYRLNEAEVSRTIATYNLNWEDKIIDPTVRDVVQSVIGKYTAEELPANRNAIAGQINEGITKTITSLQDKPVQLQEVHLREIILPSSVKEQIERVQIARQEAERAAQEAIKKATLAEGEANATIISSKGRADAVRIEADAQAYANKEIASSLNNPLLNLRQIEVQGKFNEALQNNKDAKIFLTPGGAVPNIWVDTKDSKTQSSISAK